MKKVKNSLTEEKALAISKTGYGGFLNNEIVDCRTSKFDFRRHKHSDLGIPKPRKLIDWTVDNRETNPYCNSENTSVMKGNWHDYIFDIRYDACFRYDEEKGKKIDGVLWILVISKGNSQFFDCFGRTINSLILKSYSFLEEERAKFID